MSAEARSQRWRDRRMSFTGRDRVIDPSIHAVDVIPCYGVAKPFVEQHHYSSSFPATRLSCGLFRNEGGKSSLVGVASFSVSMNSAAGPKYTGLNEGSSVELGRLVLLDHIEGNAESWFMSRAFSLLRSEKPAIEAVYAYSDPVPRLDPDQGVIMPGHIGEIYQALNADCRGRSRPRTHYTTPDQRLFSERALSKIRLEERGSDYAEKDLLERGAPDRLTGESGRDWIGRLIDMGFLGTRRHPGNWIYAFGLTRKAKARSRSMPSVAYPRRTGNNRDVSDRQDELDFAA